MTLKEYCYKEHQLQLINEWSEKNIDMKPNMILINNSSKVWWKCKCGNEWKESVVKRINGKGCSICNLVSPQNVSLKTPRKDITGKRFGRLTVLEHAGVKKESIWKCQCDCGNEIMVIQTNLMNGKTTSCGCKRDEVRRNNFKNSIHFVDGTCIEKIAAKTTHKNNTTGFRGVSRRENGRFRVSITFKGNRYDLGTYKTLEEAIEARIAGEVMVDEFVENFRKSMGVLKEI
ncbi:MAG: zinc-ribbon domain-containing protein [Clostridia bacterium]